MDFRDRWRIMYFADLLTSIGKELCIQEFLKICDDAPDINRLIDALDQAIENMKHLRPVYSVTSTIQIGHAEDQFETYDYAYLIETGVMNTNIVLKWYRGHRYWGTELMTKSLKTMRENIMRR